MMAPYAPGKWRLEAHALESVALSFSHILVVHQGSRSGEQSNLRGPNWSAEQKSERPREAALARAAQIALEARAAPESFEDLALRYSDDLVTRAQGGSLGTWTADIVPSEFLDALAAMKTGETSRVVETSLGFHVLKRRAAPAESEVSARRILIAYQTTAPFLKRNGRSTARTRDEARALAERVVQLARREPASFSELVRQYSDHRDVLRDGDIGVWPLSRSFPFSREVEVLASMRIGEISDPLDSMEGFNVFQRTEITPRARLALDEIVLTPSPGPGGHPDAREIKKAEKLQRKVLKDVSAHPERFAHYQSTYCCRGRREWSEGRGVPELERTALSLDVGKLALLPLDPEAGVLRVVKRVAAKDESPAPPLQAELPAPERPNVDALVGRISDGDALARYVSELANSIPAELNLDDRRQKELDVVVAQLVSDLKTRRPEQRLAALRDARMQFAAILGEQLYAQLRASVDRKLTQQMMAQ